MKELIRKYVLIDKVLNIVKSQNEDALFLINEKFNMFKDTFLKTYGFNNESLTAEKVSKILSDFIQNNSLPSENIEPSEELTLYERFATPEKYSTPQEFKTPQIEVLFGVEGLYGNLRDDAKTYGIYNTKSA